MVWLVPGTNSGTLIDTSILYFQKKNTSFNIIIFIAKNNKSIVKSSELKSSRGSQFFLESWTLAAPDAYPSRGCHLSASNSFLKPRWVPEIRF